MPEYILTGTGPNGRRVTERVEADRGEDAVRELEDRGFTNVVLKTDDVMAAVGRPSEVPVSSEEYVAYGRMSFPVYVLSVVGKSYREMWWVTLLAAGWVAHCRWSGEPFSFSEALALLVLAGPAVVIPLFLYFSPSRKYNELMDAVVWGRWGEVFQRLPGLRLSIPAHEWALRKAQALAGTGRLDEGLRLFAKFGDGKLLPDWLYASLVPDIYSAAREREKAFEASARAVALAPDNPTVLLSHAMSTLRLRRDARQAQALLDQARQKPISDMLTCFVTIIEGVIALERGDAPAAAADLRRALGEMGPIRGSPLSQWFDALVRAYLALALAAAGDPAGAGREFRRAEPMLRAHHADDLLGRASEALGVAG